MMQSASVGDRRAYKAAKQREYRAAAAAGESLTAAAIDRLVLESVSSLLEERSPVADAVLERIAETLRWVPDAELRVYDRLDGFGRRTIRPTAYRVDGPAIIGFSGGRSSAYMTAKMIESYGGRLPERVQVVFCNTGLEHERTLDFVNEFSRRYDQEIVWLEYDPDEPLSTRVVNYETASRDGRPYTMLIERRNMLPNVKARFCTEELKIRRTQRYARHVLGWRQWTSIVGLRADEERRVRKMREGTEKHRRRMPLLPMVEAGATNDDVLEYWGRNPMDLQLPVVNGATVLGNCVGCFLKGKRKLISIFREYPEVAEWWVDQESWIPSTRREGDWNRFAKDWRYEDLLAAATAASACAARHASQENAYEDEDEEEFECACTD